jgi:hypothetical protein
MSEEFQIVEMGDSGEETMQTAPNGPHFDSAYGWGWSGGRAD